MRRLEISVDTSEENIKALLDYATTISALKVVELFNKHNIFDYFTRSRSPEEIFHMLNFSNLEKFFGLTFNVLEYKKLLEREGEFYKLSPRFNMILDKLEEEKSSAPSRILKPVESLFDSLLTKYIAILNGKHGRIDHNELYNAFDRLYGTEFMLAILKLYYTTMVTRLPGIKEKETIHVLNWGVGSGYEAILLAQLFGRKVDVISAEPEGTIEKAYVLQDFYEVHNVQFIERKDLNLDLLKGSVEIFMGRQAPAEHIKSIVNIVLVTLSSDGYFTSLLSTELSMSFNWIFTMFLPYSTIPPRENLIARMKHYGLGKVKYVGFNNELIALQKL